MKKNIFAELTDEKLLKKRDLLKGISIGFGIIFILVISILIYILAAKDFKNINIATLIPVFVMPITFTPLLINLGLINKEIKSRNL
ncbi:MAG: hypothetical protein V4666_05655 [Bacteroidota bacterium]